MKKHVLNLSALIYCSVTFSQSPPVEWIQHYGENDEALQMSIISDDLDNVYICGTFYDSVDLDPGVTESEFQSNGQLDFFVQKLAPDGSLVWAKSFGGPEDDVNTAITLDNLGNVIVVGTFHDSINFDSTTPTNYHYANGSQYDIFILKLDTDGEYLWSQTYGGTSAERAMAVTVDSNNIIYLTGFFIGTVDFDPGMGIDNVTSNPGSYEETFIHKIDPAGAHIWVKTLVGTSANSGQGRGIKVDHNNNLVITGTFTNSCDFDPGPGETILNISEMEGFILKLDNDGNLFWVKRTYGNSTVTPVALQIDSNNDYIICGNFYESIEPPIGSILPDLIGDTSSQDIFVQKYSSVGNLLWMSGIVGTGQESAYYMDIGPSGNIYISGSFNETVDFDMGPATLEFTPSHAIDAFLINIKNDGSVGWVQTVGGMPFFTKSTVASNSLGNIYFLTIFETEASFNPAISPSLPALENVDLVLVKYNSFLNSEEQISNSQAISVYPNPTNQMVYVDLSGQTGMTTISIYDVVGNIIFSDITAAAIYCADLSEFVDGVYLINIQNGAISKILKVIKR